MAKQNEMKLLAGFLLLFIAKAAVAQTDSLVVKRDSVTQTIVVNNSGYDKILLDSGDSLFVNIVAETETEVAYKYPFNTMINKTSYSKVKEIHYKDGKLKAMQNVGIVPGVGADPDNLWRIVAITYDESDVAGLKEIGPISAKAEGRSLKTSIDLLEKNVTVNLKKSALRMNATKVLVKKKNIEQSYGEIPLVELEGVAYGVN
jgi:hypothetical protein